jgi:hypothetical protein
MVAMQKPKLRVCLKCGTAKDAEADFRKNEPCWCKACRSVAEKKSKSRPAYKALARDRSRIAMRAKRQASDDALNLSDRVGFLIFASVHAYIPTPVEEIEAREAYVEAARDCYPLIPHRCLFGLF